MAGALWIEFLFSVLRRCGERQLKPSVRRRGSEGMRQ